MTWKPIETAPGDVFLLLAWFDTSSFHPQWLYEVDAARLEKSFPPLGRDNDGWRHPYATHWQPLPDPPFGELKPGDLAFIKAQEPPKFKLEIEHGSIKSAVAFSSLITSGL